MAIFNQLSFTARAFPRHIAEIERVEPLTRRLAVREHFKAARELFEQGASSVEIITWNNWKDDRGNTRFQSCSCLTLHRDSGRLYRRRVNMFG